MATDLDARIKVAQVLFSGLGGHASVAFSLIRGDRASNWESSLLFIGIEPLVPAYAARCASSRIRFESIHSRRGRPWLKWPAIYAALCRLGPNTVLLHSISSLLPVALYCLIHGARLITVEHTSLALKTRAERFMSNLSFVFAQRIVVLTQEYKDAYLKEVPWFGRPDKIEVIPTGIDVRAFTRAGAKPVGEAFHIGMAGRFSSTKRQDVLIQALKVLIQRRPDVIWSLTLAGDGDCLADARNLANANGVGGRVTFEGNLDEPALIDWFQSLDLYVHASEGEALSTSILQAMAMELPLMASNVPGIGSLLSQSPEVGLLMEANDGGAFARGIEAVHGDPQLRSRLSSSARALVCDHYSCEAMFVSYNRLLRGSGDRHRVRRRG